jgi:biotin operon repressor
MTQQAFTRHNGGVSQRQKILEVLSAHPGEWVRMVELGFRSGSWNVHSRISELRKRGCDIEQRNEYPGKRAIKSFYRLIPEEAA